MTSLASQLLINELRQRGKLAATDAIRHNRGVFASLTECDKRRAAGVAYAVAARLFEVPASRLQQLGADRADDPTVEALRELFGLDDLDSVEPRSAMVSDLSR